MRYIVLIAVLMFSVSGKSQKNFNEAEANTEIKSATVFLRGAQVHRTGSAQVDAGYNTVILRGLSTSIDGGSIQIKGDKNYTIISVNYQKNYMQEAEDSPKIKSLKNRLQKLEIEQKQVSTKKTVLQREKDLIVKNKKVTSPTKGLDIEDVMDMSDLIRERYPEINAQMKQLDEREADLKEEIVKVRAQLREENAKTRRETGEIYIDITARAAGTIRFGASYLVQDAGWSPAYDIRAFSVEEPLYMTYKANVWQNTGVEWDKINLTLSTGNPSQGATPPDVGTWRLDFDEPVALYYGYDDADGAYPETEAEEEMELNEVAVRADKSSRRDIKREEYKERQTSAQHTTMNSDRVNTEWSIDIPYTIPMTGKSQSVEISQLELNSHYAHYAAPKVDIDAFLLAYVTDWEQYNLLPGHASIYFEGAYTGKAYIETRTTRDTLDLSMGRDQSIVIEREKIKDFSKIQTIGSNKKVSNGIEITVRNTKNEKVSMKVVDQIPRSKNKEVEVSLEDADGGKLNSETGEITWDFDLEPGATKTIRFIFEVKYPKDWTVANL